MASKKGSGKVVDIRTRKTVSGENIPEGHRNTEAVKLRMKPEVAKVIRDLAEKHDMTLSDIVEHAVLLYAESHAPELRRKRVEEQYGDMQDNGNRKAMGLPLVHTVRALPEVMLAAAKKQQQEALDE